jgi:hypothetical protein
MSIAAAAVIPTAFFQLIIIDLSFPSMQSHFVNPQRHADMPRTAAFMKKPPRSETRQAMMLFITNPRNASVVYTVYHTCKRCQNWAYRSKCVDYVAGLPLWQ